MSYSIIDVTSSPNQRFVCQIPIDGKNKRLSFFLRYCEISEYWLMDVGEADTNNIYITAVPLLPGDDPSGNILRQYSHLKIGSAGVLSVTKTNEDHPGATTLGTDWKLVWGDTP